MATKNNDAVIPPALGPLGQEIADVLSTVKLSELDELQRRAVAGLFAQALCGSSSQEQHIYCCGFLSDLCERKLGLPLDTTRAMLPLLGTPPVWSGSGSTDETLNHPLLQRNTVFGFPASGFVGQDSTHPTKVDAPVGSFRILSTSVNDGAPTREGLLLESPFLKQISPDTTTRWRILLTLYITYISEANYDARLRQVFRRACAAFQVAWPRLAAYEDAFVQHLCVSLAVEEVARNSKQHSQKTVNTAGRWAMIGLAAVAGAGLMVATAGLAAPALLGGFAILGGAVGFGATATALVAFFSTTGGAALLLTLFGVSGGGLASYRMARRTAGLSEFYFESLLGQPRDTHDATGSSGDGVDGADTTTGAPASTAASGAPTNGGIKRNSFVKSFTNFVGMTPSPSSAAPATAVDAPVATPHHDAELVSAGRQAAAKINGGLHTFVVCSGMLLSNEKAKITGTNTDFVVPWGGYFQDRLLSDATADAARSASTSSPTLPSPTAYRQSLKARFSVLRPAVSSDEDFIRRCSSVIDAGPAPPVTVDTTYIICMPLAEPAAPPISATDTTKSQPDASAEETPDKQQPSVTFQDIGFLSYRSTEAAPHVLDIQMAIEQRRFWGHGVGQDALIALLSHLCVNTEIAAAGFTFHVPIDRTLAIAAAEKVGFECQALVDTPGGMMAKLTVDAIGFKKALRKLAAAASNASAARSKDHIVVCGACGHTGGAHAAACKANVAAETSFLSAYPDALQLLDRVSNEPAGNIEVLFEKEEKETTPHGHSRGDSSTTSPSSVFSEGDSLMSVIIPSREALASVAAGVTSTLVTTVKVSSKVGVYGAGAIVSDAGWLHKDIPYGDKYTLVFESEQLKALGDATSKFAQQFLTSQAISTVLQHTVMATLLAAWSLPSYVVKALSFIDSPWALSLDRADKAGKVLAKLLLDGSHGQRPVTLIGYGIGARVVFSALREIAAAALATSGEHRRGSFPGKADATKARRTWEFLPSSPASDSKLYVKHMHERQEKKISPFGIVHDAVLMGAPVNASADDWKDMRRVVSGRLVNVYATNDFVLRYVYRSVDMVWQVAGLSAVSHPVPPSTSTSGSKPAPEPLPSDKPNAASSDASVAPEIHSAGADDKAKAASEPRTPDKETTSSSSRYTPVPEELVKLPVSWYAGVESVDATGIVGGHLDYRNKLQFLLKSIGLECTD